MKSFQNLNSVVSLTVKSFPKTAYTEEFKELVVLFQHSLESIWIITHSDDGVSKRVFVNLSVMPHTIEAVLRMCFSSVMPWHPTVLGLFSTSCEFLTPGWLHWGGRPDGEKS